MCYHFSVLFLHTSFLFFHCLRRKIKHTHKTNVKKHPTQPHLQRDCFWQKCHLGYICSPHPPTTFFLLLFLSFNLKPLCFRPPTEVKCCVHFILSTCSSSKVNLLSVIVWSYVVLKVDSPVAGIVLRFISDYTLCLWEPCSGFPAYWAVQWSWFARVNALCNLSHKVVRGHSVTSGPIS